MRKNIFVRIVGVLVLLTVSFLFSASCFAGEVKLSKKEKDEITKIIAASWNCFGKNFTRDELTNTELIQFGILNSGFTPKKYLANGHYYLPAKYVEAVVNKYFNLKVKNESVVNSPYKNGQYEVSPSDAGEGNRIEITGFAGNSEQYLDVFADFSDVDSGQLFIKTNTIFNKVITNGKVRYIVFSFMYQKQQ